jgi:hypothetical protein
MNDLNWRDLLILGAGTAIAWSPARAQQKASTYPVTELLP